MRKPTSVVSVPVLMVALAVLSALAVSPAAGQRVSGRTVAASTDAPLGGVFVTLVDDAGRRVAGYLSQPGGTFLVRAPVAGRYRLRAELIGYGSIERVVDLAADETVNETLRLRLEAIQLEGIVARSSRERQCSLGSAEGDALARLWAEARKSLEIAEWAREERWLRATGYTYQRVLDLVDFEVLAETVRRSGSLQRAAFAAPDPELIRAEGFIVREDQGGALYRGADAALLLSDAFLETHCFTLREREEEGLVGLRFEPTPGRDVTEIEGVLWLDAATGELRRLEYEYTDYPLTAPLPRSTFGGLTHFRHLPGGGVAVSRWRIRMPRLAHGADRLALHTVRRCGPHACGDPSTRRALARAGLSIEEEGGEVLSFRLPDGTTLPAADRAALAGVVLDSTAAGPPAPLAGAEVVIQGTRHRALTDARGRFRLDDLPEGAYRLRFRHPRLAELGIERPQAVLASARLGEVSSVTLGVPSRATLAIARCGVQGGPPGSDGPIIHGRVRDAATGSTIVGAGVRLLPAATGASPDSARTLLYQRTDAAGHYLFCNVPANAARLTVDYLGAGRHLVEVTAGDRALEVDVDLVLSRAAQLRGRVVRAANDEAVEGVVVRIVGTDMSTMTTASGEFSFDSVAPGAVTLVTDHMAFRPTTGAVAVSGGELVRVELRVDDGVFELDPLVVTGRSQPLLMDERLRGFHIRRARDLGTFFGPDDLAGRPDAGLTSVLRDVPGITVTSMGARGVILRGRGNESLQENSSNPYCSPMVYLNGMPISVRTATLEDLEQIARTLDAIPFSEIAGVEVYAGAANVPGEFAGLNPNCGAVAVWTHVRSRGNGSGDAP